jgi:hypothetical protein
LSLLSFLDASYIYVFDLVTSLESLCLEFPPSPLLILLFSVSTDINSSTYSKRDLSAHDENLFASFRGGREAFDADL